MPYTAERSYMTSLGVISVKRIGDTLYVVRSVTSATANETAYEKVRRLILDDAEKAQRTLPETLDKSSVLSHNTVPA